VNAIALGGPALHSGTTSAVVLTHRPGLLALRQRDVEIPFRSLRVDRADYGVTVRGQSLRVDLVEHLFAAIAGLAIVSDLRVDVYGSEIPLLDGGALRFSRALRQLGFASGEPIVTVARAATFRWGESVYRFSPFPTVRIVVNVQFDHALIQGQRACWQGDPQDFLERIAPARTFGFRRDAEQLQAVGRARAVDLRSVVVLDENGTCLSDPPPSPDECVRHKLLDLLGDLMLWGGVPTGHVEVTRPGHRATHSVMGEAWARGVVVDAR